MNDAKQNLAAAVRDARTGLGLSQEKLAEILNIDSRTIRGIEAGRGNPKFEKLYPLITYLKIPASKIFDPDYKDEAPNLQKHFLSDEILSFVRAKHPLPQFLLEVKMACPPLCPPLFDPPPEILLSARFPY